MRKDRCTLNLVVPLHGGGAKTEHILSVKAELAKLCINSGILSQQVSLCVEQVFNRIGLQKVQHILTGKGDNWSELQSVCKEVSLPVPATNEIASSVRAERFRQQNPPVERIATVDASKFRLKDGFSASAVQMPHCLRV